ncbi:hypothetical protein U9M48_026246 [Paspalum notatum var. saurae]|uniref:F-box domain-containing protein n=1 Tax=Paspalum notatum var. saurae TaxID=547442 RepID=A0AAQ3TQI8_PASNO
MEVEQLPDDILADVLRRLPPCSLAASRCVRKHWCSVIDTRRLLRADLLPLRLDALLFNNRILYPLISFATPSAARQIAAALGDFSEEIILDHCNGLLLLPGKVANLATRQQLLLPPSWPPHPPVPPCGGGCGGITVEDLYVHQCLVYDPMMMSPQHFEVFRIPYELGCRSSEWPPSPYTVTVFSSSKWRWEERSFVRQIREPSSDNDVAADMRHYEYYCRRSKCRQAVYFCGAIYVHFQNHSVTSGGRGVAAGAASPGQGDGDSGDGSPGKRAAAARLP